MGESADGMTSGAEGPGREARTAATAVFEKDVGIWDVDMEIRPTPDAAVLLQKAVATNHRICDGHWLVVEHRAESGFEGHGIYGWDAAKGVYTGVWVDSMQPGMAQSEGAWDPSTRTMTFVTETTYGPHTVRYREITETRSDGTQLYRNLVPTPDGGEFELIRATYRRRRAGS